MFGGPDRRGMRKPLVLFTPKSLLRHARATSTFDDLTGGAFLEVIGETGAIDPDHVTRVAFCSGKVYYDLLAARDGSHANHVAVIRVEQLYPFPEAGIREILQNYPAAEAAWVQEEPRNMGAWRFMQERMDPLLGAAGRGSLAYVGRPESASPATGLGHRHQQEQALIVADAVAEMPLAKVLGVRIVARR
jgi:2-oxoglutarate dehydrogenase E1 component